MANKKLLYKKPKITIKKLRASFFQFNKRQSYSIIDGLESLLASNSSCACGGSGGCTYSCVPTCGS